MKFLRAYILYYWQISRMGHFVANDNVSIWERIKA